MEFSLGKHGNSSEQSMHFLLELFELPYGWEQTFAVSLGFLKPWLVAAPRYSQWYEGTCLEKATSRHRAGDELDPKREVLTLVTLDSMMSLLVTAQLHTLLFISFLSLGPFVVLVFGEGSLLPRQLRMAGKVKSLEEVFALSHLGPLPASY